MFQDDLKEFLLSQFPDARLASGGKEIVMRCRFCGDSKDPKSRHFYISLGYDGKPPMYNCFRANCSESGVLTSNKLRMMSVYDTSFAIELDKHNNYLFRLPQNRIYKETGIARLNNVRISDDPLSSIKLTYINKRLGLNLGKEDLFQNKIILNLYDLLYYNNITNYTRYKNIMDDLNESFIGFISMDNSFVNMKNLRPGKVSQYIDTKYVNYNIFGKADNSKRHYILPNQIDLTRPDPIQIHVGEGAFDALSVFYNLRGANKDHSIYASIGGKSYINIIKLFILEMGIINADFHIYIDNDIDDWEIQKIKDYMDGFNFNIYLHRNIYPGEKDFGVKLSNIKEQITLLKGRI
jgi:hypothetical protein